EAATDGRAHKDKNGWSVNSQDDLKQAVELGADTAKQVQGMGTSAGVGAPSVEGPILEAIVCFFSDCDYHPDGPDNDACE
ncbi:MAG: hypothetical protein QF464_11915, partial [Myxococcota bacterium]|nr:hypothetical protein [Myxococcota bacterium]